MESQLPEEWIDIIRKWADPEPMIRAAFIFGSRAKGLAREDSDLDIALWLAGTDDAERLANWICEAKGWEEHLSGLLLVEIDLQAINADDARVGPAVDDHGICILDRRDD